MDERPTPEAAVRAAQSVLRRSSENLIIDGRWGSFTHAAYERAPEADRVQVDSILSSRNLSAADLIAYNRAQKDAGGVEYTRAKDRARAAREKDPAYQVTTTVHDAIAKASAATGVPVKWLTGFVRIESGFNPNAVNGQSKGLMQVQPPAWADVAKVDPSVGSYANVFDPYKNALVGARYLLLNSERLKHYGYTGPVTPAVLYLAHQQGAAGFVELWKASQGMPFSTHYVSTRAMKGNPPPDSQGTTTDRSEFYRRWLAVAERKVGT